MQADGNKIVYPNFDSVVLGVRVFYAPNGVEYDDGIVNAEGWYIQTMYGVNTPDGDGSSDGIGPFDTIDEAFDAIKKELGTALPLENNKEGTDEFNKWRNNLSNSEVIEPLRTP